jgi:hypothetical protein
MSKSTFLILLLVQSSLFAQKKTDVMLNIPVDKNWILTVEKKFKDRPKLKYYYSFSHKFNASGDLRFNGFLLSEINENSIKRNRIDFGLRSYAQPIADKRWLNLYLGLALQTGYMSRQFVQYIQTTPIDSLTQKSFYLGAEATAGIKVVIGKRLIISPSFGVNYSVPFHNNKQISRHPYQWYQREYSLFGLIEGIPPINFQSDPVQRRKDIMNEGFGWMPSIYINFGWRI